MYAPDYLAADSEPVGTKPARSLSVPSTTNSQRRTIQRENTLGAGLPPQPFDIDRDLTPIHAEIISRSLFYLHSRYRRAYADFEPDFFFLNVTQHLSLSLTYTHTHTQTHSLSFVIDYAARWILIERDRLADNPVSSATYNEPGECLN